MKWTNISEKKYALRSITYNGLKVPEKPMLKCLGFTYNGAKVQYFYNIKNGSSNITSKSLSKNLSNENKQWCFCSLQAKT